jgi:phosphatidylserine decarboxylase
MLHAIRLVVAPPHRAATPFLIAAGVALLAGLVVHIAAIAILGGVFGLFCLYFFRDPERVPSPVAGTFVAPADGTVTSVGHFVPPLELGMGPEPRLRIAIFLSVLNVHVNRMPASGTVVAVARRPGKFLNASLDKASDENERVALRVRLDDGGEIAVVQIAGLIARRILCDVSEGMHVERGARFGIIRFGSRTDVYLPDGCVPLVAVGQTMVGGETAVARAR